MNALTRLFRRRTEPTRFTHIPAPSHSAAPLRQTPAEPRRLSPGEAFTPTQPRAGRRRAVGRRTELQRVLQALQDDRAHVVLYAERGRGKTSLSNLAVEALRRDGVIVARHTCDAGSSFDTILHGLMRDLPPALLAGESAIGDGCVDALPPHPLGPSDVVALPGRLTCRRLVCVIDEFDRVTHAETKIRLADTIKQLSDSDTPLLFMIVGVSDDLDQILGHHPSIQRSVVGIHLPLLPDRDIAEIIVRGARDSGFSFAPSVVGRVALLSRGMPTMAQLLGLRLAQAAQERGAQAVEDQDVDEAVERMIENASRRVTGLYAGLTDHDQDADMVGALRLIAFAPQDVWGRIVVPVGPGEEREVGGHPIAPACWTRIEQAGVLQPSGEAASLFTLQDRPLMQHVMLLAARSEIPANPPPHESEPESEPDPEPVSAAGLHPTMLDRRSEWTVS